MMTWWRENWRLYRIRCEIWSEINGIVNVTSFWVSSWDRGLLVPYLSLINKIFLVAKTVRLVILLYHRSYSPHCFLYIIDGRFERICFKTQGFFSLVLHCLIINTSLFPWATLSLLKWSLFYCLHSLRSLTFPINSKWALLQIFRNTNEFKNVSVYSNSTDDQYTELDGS